jgi:hypothetical protein
MPVIINTIAVNGGDHDMRRNNQTTEDPLYTELMAAAVAEQGTMAGTTSQSSEAKPGFHRAELQPAQRTDPKPAAAATPQPTGAEAGSDRVNSGPWSPWQPDAPADKPNQRTFSTTQTGPREPYPAEIEPIIDRAMRGDQTVLPELKRAFDKYPDWVNWFGDLTEQARQSQLHVIAGNCLLAKEAIVRKMDQLRASLVGEGVSPLEALLIDRIGLDWMATQGADKALSEKLLQLPSAHPGIKAAGQRLDAASRRFSNDLKTLALIRKLLRPIPSTLDLLKQPIADNNVGGAAHRDAAPLSSGVPVLN